MPFFGNASDGSLEFSHAGLLFTSSKTTSANLGDLLGLFNSILLLDLDLSFFVMRRESRRDVLFVDGVRRVVRDINYTI